MKFTIYRWCQIGENDKMIDINDAVIYILRLELRYNENRIGNLSNDGFLHRKKTN